MKNFYILLIILFNIFPASAEWNYYFNGQNFWDVFQQGNYVFFFRNNGITKLDLSTGEKTNLNSLNSELKSNVFNSVIKLADSSLLISTKNGLNLIKDGEITDNSAICENFPNKEAIKLYCSSDTNIWTFSKNEVYSFDGNLWHSIDISDSLINKKGEKYPFEIEQLLVRKNECWVLFNDLTAVNKDPNYFSVEPFIKVAIIREGRVVKTFQDKSESFPYAQGSVTAIDLDDKILWKRKSYIYSYDGQTWTKPSIFASQNTSVVEFSNLILDDSGKVWYLGTSNNFTFPVCYNPLTNEITIQLKDSSISNLYNILKFNDGTISAYSNRKLYLLNNNNWKLISIKDLGVDSTLIFFPKNELINGKKYVQVINVRNYTNNGIMACLDDNSQIHPINKDYPYSVISKVEFNKFGKGAIAGLENNSREPYGFQSDSGFVKFWDVTYSNPSIKLSQDGNIYFNYFRTDKSSTNSSAISTWEGNEIISYINQFKDKPKVRHEDFVLKGDFLFTIGSYFYTIGDSFWLEVDPNVFLRVAADTMSNYLSILNLKDKTIQSYDLSNTKFPAYPIIWYQWEGPNAGKIGDTTFKMITVDKEYNAWILTSKTLLKFSSSKDVFNFAVPDIEKYTANSIIIQIEADDENNEIILLNHSKNKILSFDIPNEKWDSIFIENTSMKGNLLRIKKLLDGKIYASDDLGYLYKYKGKGKFEIIPLNIFGNINAKTQINDFCQGADGKFYLGTDIGLFVNADFSDIRKENPIKSTDFTVFPNPATDYITLNIPPLEKMELGGVLPEIKIFDIFGNRVLLEETIHELSLQKIDISTLPAGVYFVRIGEKVEKFVVVK